MLCKTVKEKGANVKRWNQAIEDAKDTIAKCERKIGSMKAAIREFQQARDDGDQYPSAEQQHSV